MPVVPAPEAGNNCSAIYARLRAALPIDKHRLDDHLEQQPSLYAEVAEQCVLVIAARDEAKLRVEEVYARLYNEITDSEQPSGKKPTRDHTDSLIRVHPEYLEANTAHTTARAEADRWLSLKESYSQRSHALRDLCQLYLANYFSAQEVRADRVGADRAEYGRIKDQRARHFSKS